MIRDDSMHQEKSVLFYLFVFVAYVSFLSFFPS